jgi:hypothetical protein
LDNYANDYDVSKKVKTTDPANVQQEIDRIFLDLYPSASTDPLDRAFYDVARMYRGEFPGFLACDTAYHDIQHVLDVTLAMARLLDGYERSRVSTDPIGEDLFQLGVVTALFHDCGYLRRNAEVGRNGAEFTRTHVSRGADFLKEYLATLGMPEYGAAAADLVHFTGYERPVATIAMPNLRMRLVGYLLGSADIIAQMADRCYLEKCRDRLYPEFVAGGIATAKLANGDSQVIFSSGDDLVMKTPGFYAGANRRLNGDLQGFHSYAGKHFGGQHVYLEEIDKNIKFAEMVSKEQDASVLRRTPPDTLSPELDAAKA